MSVSVYHEMAVSLNTLYRIALTTSVLATVALSLSLYVLFTLPSTTSPPATNAPFVGIQHSLYDRNDTRIGTPSSGYVYADFSLRIMNCGYERFDVSRGLFVLVLNGASYNASDATSQLASPLKTVTLLNEQETFGQLAFEIPAVSQIPDTPLSYTLSQSYTIKWTSNW